MEDDGDAGAAGEGPGIEYRMLYNKAVEEFICSSEIAYRLLLKEYVVHLNLRKPFLVVALTMRTS